MTSPTNLWLAFSVREPRSFIDFLVAAFGFTEVIAYPNDTGSIAHAELAGPDGRGGLMLGAAREGGAKPFSGAYVVVPDIDALIERATKAGAEVVDAPYDTDYGSRDCTLRDPEGGVWHFGTYAGHPLQS